MSLQMWQSIEKVYQIISNLPDIHPSISWAFFLILLLSWLVWPCAVYFVPVVFPEIQSCLFCLLNLLLCIYSGSVGTTPGINTLPKPWKKKKIHYHMTGFSSTVFLYNKWREYSVYQTIFLSIQCTISHKLARWSMQSSLHIPILVQFHTLL